MENVPWTQIITALATLGAAFLGFLLAGINEAKRDARAAAHQREVRAEEKLAAAMNARQEFQRETLLSLQDAIQLMARLTGRTLHFDHMNARKNLQTQLPEEYSNEIYANGVDVIRLRNRILNDELREIIVHFAEACSRISGPPSGYTDLSPQAVETHADALRTELGTHYKNTMDQLGTVLRAELEWMPQ